MTSEATNNPLKLLIVEDSSIIVERLTMVLSELKQVSVIGSASNITSALRTAHDHKPDIVLLDIHLKDDAPGANGIDLLLILRTIYPQLNIIMMSNLSGDQYIKRCFELGADYFIDKSNDLEEIPVVIKKICDSETQN